MSSLFASTDDIRHVLVIRKLYSMYSLTETGVHLIHPPSQSEPQIKMECKCKRVILQEEIYTCLSCASYCCHYCTVPELSSYQCRACKRMFESSIKNNKCNFCFSCPFCENVLTLSRDPKSKCWIYLCQFCYWNSKEINMKEERPQILQDNLTKLKTLREGQNRIYSTAYTFFKESNIALEMENQFVRYTHTRRPSIRASIEESGARDQRQLKKLNQGLETMVKHTSIDDDSEEYNNNEHKYPQALPLQTKKIRRCPECSKHLTNIYRPVVSNEPSVEVMHKQLKVLQCQRVPAIEGKVKVRFLKNCLLEEKQYKVGEMESVPINTTLKVKAFIESKRRNAQVVYNIVIEPYRGGK